MPTLDIEEQFSPTDGTRKQFTSQWTFIEDTGTHEFTHGLGEIPPVCDVIESLTEEGKNPVSSTATVTKTTTTITVVSAAGEDKYFQVRAF